MTEPAHAGCYGRSAGVTRMAAEVALGSLAGVAGRVVRRLAAQVVSGTVQQQKQPA